MIDKTRLTEKLVMFRMTRSNSVYSGTVKHVENDGVWIETPDLLVELAQDAAWKNIYQRFVGQIQQSKQPAFFLPFAALQFLIAAQD